MGYCARDGSGDGKAHYFPRVGVTLDHVADANARLSLTAEGVVVSGAGTAGCNGVYTQRGTSSGKPYYNLHSQPDSTGDHVILWNGSTWRIQRLLDNGPDYTSDDDVAYPWLVVTWGGGGDPPVPTVIHSPGQVTGAGYQVIQDSDGLTYTFNGDGADADAGLLVTGASVTNWNGSYLNNAVNSRYDLLPDLAQRIDSSPSWVMGSDYVITVPGGYPWSAPWETPEHGPGPTVTRNPIASEANWT